MICHANTCHLSYALRSDLAACLLTFCGAAKASHLQLLCEKSAFKLLFHPSPKVSVTINKFNYRSKNCKQIFYYIFNLLSPPCPSTKYSVYQAATLCLVAHSVLLPTNKLPTFIFSSAQPGYLRTSVHPTSQCLPCTVKQTLEYWFPRMPLCARLPLSAKCNTSKAVSSHPSVNFHALRGGTKYCLEEANQLWPGLR